MIVDNDRVCQGVKSISHYRAFLIKQRNYLNIKYFIIKLQYTNNILLVFICVQESQIILGLIFNNRKGSSFIIFTHIVQLQMFIVLNI